LAVRRTRGGDAWQARQEGAADRAAGDLSAASGGARDGGGRPVLLGMPSVGQPGT
jgi:hypothetical protein